MGALSDGRRTTSIQTPGKAVANVARIYRSLKVIDFVAIEILQATIRVLVNQLHYRFRVVLTIIEQAIALEFTIIFDF